MNVSERECECAKENKWCKWHFVSNCNDVNQLRLQSPYRTHAHIYDISFSLSHTHSEYILKFVRFYWFSHIRLYRTCILYLMYGKTLSVCVCGWTKLEIIQNLLLNVLRGLYFLSLWVSASFSLSEHFTDKQNKHMSIEEIIPLIKGERARFLSLSKRAVNLYNFQNISPS